MYQIKAKIIANRRITSRYYNLVIDAPQIAKFAKPGQFVNVCVSKGNEPFLRKPFSIYRIGPQNVRKKSKIELLYKVVGKGTDILTGNKTGDYINIIGPLGNGFVLPPKTNQKQQSEIILIGGGIGVVPLLFLAECLKNNRSLGVSVLVGIKSKEESFLIRDFNKLDCRVKVATEDGSNGFKGLVTKLLKEELGFGRSSSVCMSYTCGPSLMLEKVSKIAEKNKVPCQVCLEEYMACGIGACLGCAVKVKNGHFPGFKYVRVCKEGPVFDSRQVIWGE